MPKNKNSYKPGLRNLDGLRHLRKVWPFEQAVCAKKRHYLRYLDEQLADYEMAA